MLAATKTGGILMQASRMHVHGGMISASQEACYKEGGVSDRCTAFFLSSPFHHNIMEKNGRSIP